MVKQIAFFVEGEEDPRDTREEKKLRKTLHRVFGELDVLAEEHGIRLQFRLYKSRQATYEKFCEAVRTGDKTTYPVLLVDSEEPVDWDGVQIPPESSWRHLRQRKGDGWEKPDGVANEQCQLMVQAIEALLFADLDALIDFFGSKNFRKNSLPVTVNVEEIPKSAHLPALEAATQNTSNGRYHKVKHLSPILYRLDSGKVRKRAPHFDRIFTTLAARIESFKR